MLNRLNARITSLSRVVVMSPHLALMARRPLVDAIQHSKLSSSLDEVVDNDTHEEDADVRKLEISLRTTLSHMTSISSAQHGMGQPLAGPTLVPCNTPTMTPSPSLPGYSKFDSSADSSMASKTSLTTGSSYTAALSVNLSFMSDNTEEEEDFCASVSFEDVFSAPRAVPVPKALPKGVGLGLSGIARKDGSGSFDGLGRVCVWSRSSQRNDNVGAEVSFGQDRPSNSFDASEADLRLSTSNSSVLSEDFLREAALTFLDDPFHESGLGPIPEIPECTSWYEIDELSVAAQETNEPTQPSPARLCRTQSAKRSVGSQPHFSTGTISSELKRSAVSTNKLGVNASRSRSISWPSTAPAPRGSEAKGGFSSSSPLKAARDWRI